MDKNKLAHKVAKKIKKSRLEIALSQGELAEAIGISDRTVSAYEIGRITPPIAVLKKISNLVGKPISYFVEENSPDYLIETKLKRIEEELEEVKKLVVKKKIR